MKKLIRNILLLIVLILVAIGVFGAFFINSISYQVSEDDLPQDVYDTSGDLLAYAKLQIVGLVLANEDDRYTMLEEIMNLILLDSIRENINTDYDPVGDCEDESCQYILKQSPAYVDYAYAYLTDDNQIAIVISFGTDQYVNIDTALFLYFDVEINILEMEVVFTLDNYSLGNRGMSKTLLDYLFDRMNKEDIEDSMTFGTLDLDKYEYTISITDALS